MVVAHLSHQRSCGGGVMVDILLVFVKVERREINIEQEVREKCESGL